jgi:hypothetical protein
VHESREILAVLTEVKHGLGLVVALALNRMPIHMTGKQMTMELVE